MRILVFDQASWDDTNAAGNTLSNLFSGWSDDEFACFFTRKQVPNNSIVSEYYSVSALDLLKNLFCKRNKNNRFTSDQIGSLKERIEKQHVAEQSSIDKLHQTNNELIYWGMEAVWRSRIWIDREFKKFIKEFSPDILFAFGTSTYILDPLISYLKKNLKTKIVLFLVDDTYGDYSKKCFFRRGYLKKSFRRCIENADLLYGISKELCSAYEETFGRKIVPLYKGCELADAGVKTLNHPLKMVYAGNLFYGRDDTLAAVADCLKKINNNGVVAELEVYTASTVTDEIEKKLNIPGTSQIMGKRPYEEIKRILAEADIVLHVESFDSKQVEYVHFSFSTKIVDCLQSGSGVLAIGPSGIASIEYLKTVPGAKIIDNPENIESILKEIVYHKDGLIEDVKKIRDFALAHHDINKIRNDLRNDFLSIIDSEGC